MNWEISQRFGKDEDLTLIIKGCLKFRKELEGDPSHLPFPQNSCCYNFKVEEEEEEGLKDIPLPLRLVLQLWETAEGWSGACAVCGNESVYGIGCGGMLSSGGVMGHCIVCHSRNYFHIGGLTRTGADLKSKIVGDTYKISKTVYGSCYSGEKTPLYERLQSLGCLELPKRSWLQEKKPDDASLEINIESNKKKL